ncbi:dixin-A isoform X7 [Lepisosteus oculatus]|uniref:dixin-A isoform X7 n=1 Tax=Lepisosteus oculatus TaxID=7918 RepID=UPI0037135AC1
MMPDISAQTGRGRREREKPGWSFQLPAVGRRRSSARQHESERRKQEAQSRPLSWPRGSRGSADRGWEQSRAPQAHGFQDLFPVLPGAPVTPCPERGCCPAFVCDPDWALDPGGSCQEAQPDVAASWSAGPTASSAVPSPCRDQAATGAPSGLPSFWFCRIVSSPSWSPLLPHGCRLSSPSPAHTPKGELAVGQSESQEGTLSAQLEEARCKAEVLVMAPLGGPVGAGEGSSWEDQLLEQQEQLEREMEEARRMISSLQALLLHGSLPEDEQEASLCLGGEGADNAEEQLIIIRSRLDQSMAESQDLKKELLRYKQETRSLQGVKDALQQRMSLQESSVLQLKQELLRASMARDELHSQNVELQRMLEERSRLLTDYKKELGHKDRLLQQQQLKLDEALRKVAEGSHLKADLQRELEHKDSLLQELMSRDVDGIEHCGPLGHSQSNGYIHPAGTASSMASTHRGRPPDALPVPLRVCQAEELQLVREALRSLRNCFSGHDPQHHTLDTLEQGIASLMDRLHALDSQRRHEKRSRGKSPGRRAAQSDRDSWPPSSKMSHSHSSPVLSSSATTKVLYFTDRSLTPFMVNIPKRLGEVTLRDFKAAVDREGSYRYHFKALDPEFGTVKEEVFHDDAVVPGWEGKIVAWVEEDHGEDRQSWWQGDPTKE